VDVSSLKRDLFQSVGATNDTGFEKRLLGAALCPLAIHFLGNDGHDDCIGFITRCLAPSFSRAHAHTHTYISLSLGCSLIFLLPLAVLLACSLDRCLWRFAMRCSVFFARVAVFL